MKSRHKFHCILVILAVAGCGDRPMKFRIVPPSESGIDFNNQLTESAEFNIFNYMYFYNGGGVAVGDLNGDDLADIFFTANQLPDKLYINKGGLKFSDVTEISGVGGFNGWTTGVTMADVNADGKLDIYVSYLGDYLIYKGKNQLLINEGNDENGIPRFTDRAMEFGLDLVGFSTQASFFDYDRDGDLDMFMLNHSLHQNGTFGKATLRNTPHKFAGDLLLKNEDGHFIDVTGTSGIFSSVIGYGLGVVVSDVNLDGWPDIYVGNDFHENDYLYMNQQDGTFKETLQDQMNHTSRYTMGVDFADFNNDLFPDLISMDMLPEDPLILKASQAEDAYDVYQFKINFGFNHQFARNNLQLNNQNGTFSEIGLMAGIAATDWSWSTLFADFDLDGKKDIFVANGILRRSNDLDYINFISTDSVQAKIAGEIHESELRYISKMPQIKLANYLYVNNGDSTFSNRAQDWGLTNESYANGAAYSDFDNDGDLDLVVNNIGDPASLYENKTIDLANRNESKSVHFVKVQLHGDGGNTQGIGAKVLLFQNGKGQVLECMPTRGYQSSVDTRLVFGVSASPVDSVVVIWNDGKFQTIKDVKLDQTLNLAQSKSSGSFNYNSLHRNSSFFKNVTTDIQLAFKHKENDFSEFSREPLLPHMLSSDGPASAVGDLNGDELDDLFFGNGKWAIAETYIQAKDQKFIRLEQPVLREDSTYEDVSAVMFDADGDKDNDVFVVSGGNEFSGKSRYRQPRLYVNDGKGKLSKSASNPSIYVTGSCVAVEDIDQDGDQDVFIGNRTKTWHYGIKQDSYILVNDGHGNFRDATDEIAPALRKFGFVKNACWADVDGDKKNDLIIAAEWSPITIFLRKENKLEPLNISGSGLENSEGWWNTIVPFDMDNDGDLDLVAGNHGINSKLNPSFEFPVKMYVDDFDKNDSTDQILTHYIKGREYPFYTRDEMTRQMPYLKKKYLSYHKFAEASITDIFTPEILGKSERHIAYTFSTSIIENLGNAKFRVKALPRPAQLSTVNAIKILDVNNDGYQDIVMAGNFYRINIQLGRNDASFGLVCLNDGKGNFRAVPAHESGFSIRGEVRTFQQININGENFYLAVRNNDSPEIFKLKP